MARVVRALTALLPAHPRVSCYYYYILLLLLLPTPLFENGMNHVFAFPDKAGLHFTDPGGMEG